MTPAIKLLKKNKVSFRVHEYTHDPDCESYGLEAAQKLGVPENRVFKTLVAALDDRQLAVAVVPVSSKLSTKLLARALGIKKVVMADKPAVERTTGYILGGVSPLGQKKRLRTIIDNTARQFATIYISAGRRGLDIEMSAEDLKRMTGGEFSDISA